MKKQFALFAALFLACGSPCWTGIGSTGFTAVAQSQSGRVTGTVTDADGEPLIGATVMVKGTKTGVTTDMDGKFAINAQSGNTLVVSYVGQKSQEIKVGSSSSVSVKMAGSSTSLNEVVVTALGIKKDKKALGYSVSDLSSEELMKNKNTNVVNSLAGKVPGVNITQSSGAAGAGATITIRGGNSAAEGRDNQPLFVVDGIIYDNSTTVVGNSSTDGMSRGNTTYSNRVMDINPEDIESMSVLKGAAAAALYGSRAADGVVIITTKKGAAGKVEVNYSGKFSTSWVTKKPEVQTQFGRGLYENNGVLNDITYSSWGEKIADGAQLYDNIGTFFANGAVLDNNVSITGGSKTGSFYLSASNYSQDGIVPNTGYDKTTFRMNLEQKYGRLTVGANASFSIASTDKTLTSGGLYDGGGNGAMQAVYSWPVQEDMSHYLNADGTKYRLFDNVLSLSDDKENPYWIINQDKITDKTKRFTGALNASFEITDWWNVSARVGYDQYKTDAQTYIAPGSVVKDIYQGGRLSKNAYNYTYITTNLMTNLHKTFGDFDLNLLLGTTTESTERNNTTHWGYNFITDGTISFNNIASGDQFFKDANSKKRLVGVYGEFRADWKNTLFLTATARNDWSSTLPIDNRSYFYPSVSGSFVFTQLLKDRGVMDTDILSFGKIRASWARVGKDANVYATATYVNNPIVYGAFTGLGNQYSSGNTFLKPEIQTSWEIGGELRFLKGRIGLDYTYYNSTTKNQIASPRLSNASGYIMTAINSGSVENKGMEIAITGKPIEQKNFSWDVTLNMSYNRGRLKNFLEGVEMFYPTDAQYGTIKAASIPNGGYFMGLVGTRFEYEKNEDGQEIDGGRYLVDPATGLYKLSTASSPIVGNREPKFIGGLNNTLRYKNLTVSFLLDLHIGGDVYNGTEYYLTSEGLSKLTTANDRESVTVKGVNSSTGEDFEQTYNANESYTINGVTYSGKAMIKKYWSNYLSNSSNFIQSVNWLKLRSLSFSYDFTDLIKNQKIIKGLSASVTGTNLFTITNYKGMDPEVSVAGGTGGSGATGIDYCSVPSTSSFTFGVNVKF